MVGTINITGKKKHPPNKAETDDILDSEWIKNSFNIGDSEIVLGNEYKTYIRKNRYFSTADMKFTCTSPGMNMAVNPKPQFTRYGDIRSKGKIKARVDVSINTTSNSLGLGMGRYYSEAIDDNQQRIFMRFGVPKYIPLLLWINKSFDIDRVILQNRGVITETLFAIIGTVASFFAIAAAPLLALGMFAINVYTQSSRFYSVKPTMYLYWSMVENILNTMVARRTMLPYVLQDYTYKIDKPIASEQSLSSSFIKSMNELIPEIIDAKTGRISVFAIALRSQAAFNRLLHEDMVRDIDKSISSDFTGYPINGEEDHATFFTNNKGEKSFTAYLFDKAYGLLMKDNPSEKIEKLSEESTATQSSLMGYDDAFTDPVTGQPIDINIDVNTEKDSIDKRITDNIAAKKSTFDKYKEYMLAELTEGAAFAIFAVDSTGSVSESFSNSSGDNPIEATFNALSAKTRNMSNILTAAADIPIVSGVLDFVSGAVAKTISEATFGIANPLLALAYGVNITMPKIWEASSASLPKSSYKFKLISPYGNAYSQLFNIYLPLAMVLAGSLPRSTGNSGYTSPLVCQLFDRGRSNIALGMIDNVTITRGTSNLSFTRSGHPNAIDVDISVANLDEIVSVDVSSAGVLSKLAEALSPDFSDSPLSSYINTIMGVDVYTQVYRIPNIMLKVKERMMVINSVINPDPAAFAAFTVNKLPTENLARLLIGNNINALNALRQQ